MFLRLLNTFFLIWHDTEFTCLYWRLLQLFVLLQSLPYVFFLNFLSFYVFAVLGMQVDISKQFSFWNVSKMLLLRWFFFIDHHLRRYLETSKLKRTLILTSTTTSGIFLHLFWFCSGNIKSKSNYLTDIILIFFFENIYGYWYMVFSIIDRCVTGENWQNVMLACMGGRACAGENSDDSCGSDFAYVYFIGFICLSAFLVGCLVTFFT